MTDYYQIIYDIMSNKGEEYATSYPEINQKNVFSISSLAHSSSKQIYWKMKNENKSESKYLSLAMTRGRAIHEFIQERLPNSWVTEYPVSWQNERFKLIGHIDAVNFKERHVLEIKTVSRPSNQHTIKGSNERWSEWQLQLGGYLKCLQFETHLDFNGSVFCINEWTNQIKGYKLPFTEIDSSWKIIIDRAEECYNKVFENA